LTFKVNLQEFCEFDPTARLKKSRWKRGRKRVKRQQQYIYAHYTTSSDLLQKTVCNLSFCCVTIAPNMFASCLAISVCAQHGFTISLHYTAAVVYKSLLGLELALDKAFAAEASAAALGYCATYNKHVISLGSLPVCLSSVGEGNKKYALTIRAQIEENCKLQHFCLSALFLRGILRYFTRTWRNNLLSSFLPRAQGRDSPILKSYS
jgi:hypothetical protein